MSSSKLNTKCSENSSYEIDWKEILNEPRLSEVHDERILTPSGRSSAIDDFDDVSIGSTVESKLEDPNLCLIINGGIKGESAFCITDCNSQVGPDVGRQWEEKAAELNVLNRLYTVDVNMSNTPEQNNLSSMVEAFDSVVSGSSHPIAISGHVIDLHSNPPQFDEPDMVRSNGGDLFSSIANDFTDEKNRIESSNSAKENHTMFRSSRITDDENSLPGVALDASHTANVGNSSSLKVSPGITASHQQSSSCSSDNDQRITEIDMLYTKQIIENLHGHDELIKCSVAEVKTDVLDIQNEYDYVKYLRISKNPEDVHLKPEEVDEDCRSIASNIGQQLPYSEEDLARHLTKNVGQTSVKTLVSKLPVVEDGLSSGHESDADDSVERGCYRYDFVEIPIGNNSLSCARSPQLQEKNQARKQNENQPQQIEVERAIHEIKLAIQKSRNRSMVQPDFEDVSSSIEVCPHQPVWITRGAQKDDTGTQTNRKSRTGPTDVSHLSSPERAPLSEEDEEDDFELLLKEEGRKNNNGKDFSDTDEETDELLNKPYVTHGHGDNVDTPDLQPLPVDRFQMEKPKSRSREVAVPDPNNPTVLIQGVLFRASYLGSTQLISEGQPSKAMRMMQAQEAFNRIKAPAGENQPSTEVDLFISIEKIMVLNTDLQEIMMDHALRTISYIADIGDILVIMARRGPVSSPDDSEYDTARRKARTKICCHVFETEEAQLVAQSIGQAFHVAYLEFLKANGIESPGNELGDVDYQDVLNQQQVFGEELNMFANKEMQKEVIVPKLRGEALGVVIVESGWGSMVPTVVIANMSPTGAAARYGHLNIGDQIISINGISLVGLPLSTCQSYIKAARNQTVVRLVVVACSPVVEVLIKRPDIKYQLGFSVQNGVICSLLRGGIAERGGVRVGHRIIDINGVSVVAIAHEKIVKMLATSVGEIHMKTMPMSVYRLLTGQDVPHYL